MFQGSMVALITPFKDGKIDKEGLRRLVEFQIENGTDVICPCGTTGESATLTNEEHHRVVEIVVDASQGRAAVMAGTGSNSTDEALDLTACAKKAGATGSLLITPYYNKPSQEGLYLHFKEIAQKVDIPIVLYNVPSRTGVNMLPETVERLSKIENIVGIKEASGSIAQGSDIINRCGEGFDVISGDDLNALPLMAVGGKGVISVTANIAPKEVSTMVHAFMEGRPEDAKKIHHRLFNLHESMFIQTNPVPVKTAAEMMGLVSAELRLPLCRMPEALDAKLKGILKSYSLIH
jgi:4-hydroxy-tetrahydrodipicolinate synthase